LGVFSSNLNSNYTTGTYTVNGKTVMINTYYNGSKILYLDRLTPDENGELTVDVRALTGSPYAFTNAFTLEYFDDNLPDEPVQNTIYREIPEDDTQLRTHVLPAPNAVTSVQPKSVAGEVADFAEVKTVSVYPNPFS